MSRQLSCRHHSCSQLPRVKRLYCSVSYTIHACILISHCCLESARGALEICNCQLPCELELAIAGQDCKISGQESVKSVTCERIDRSIDTSTQSQSFHRVRHLLAPHSSSHSSHSLSNVLSDTVSGEQHTLYFLPLPQTHLELAILLLRVG